MARHPGGPIIELPNFYEILRQRALHQSGRRVYSFLADGEGEETHLTLGELDRRARALGAHLQGLGLAGERALLLYPPGLEFISAFLGCLYAGVVAVPAYLPRINRPMDRLRAILADAGPRAVCTVTGHLAEQGRWSVQVPELQGLHWVATDGLDEALAEGWRDPSAGPETLAFLQYTSGSTAASKGVMITHRNLLHNSDLIHRSFETGPDVIGVFWLPLYHDMGLIGGALNTLYCGGRSTLLSPVAFLQRPVRWLQAISRDKASISGGPNFAYDLCVRKVTAEQKAGLDLSHWRVAFNGAEPIRPETLERFVEAFAPCGFRREAFLPCYGLAEATLLVAGGPAQAAPVVVPVRSADLDQGRAVLAEPGTTEGVRTLVGSGRPLAGQEVAIVDPESRTRCPEGRVGEIWVSGPSVARGYWNQSEASAETFQAALAGTGHGPFLRTGDLGFLRGGELFVTGRLKDLIIVRGRNVYPQDVEWTVQQSHPALRLECGAAFAVEVSDEERLVVVQEVERLAKDADVESILRAIRRAVAEQHELELHAVLLLKAGSIPKTSSGKIQRHACRDGFLAGRLDVVGASVTESGVGPKGPRAETTRTGRSVQDVEGWLVGRVAGHLGVAHAEVDVRMSFSGFGLGSLQAATLAGELEEWLGRPLSPTLIYEYPTIESLARHLAGEPAELAAPAGRDSGPEPHVDRIAIIGIGCRFPGAAGPEAFWELLRDGVDAVGEVPADRWDADAYYDPDPSTPGKINTRRGGFLDQVDRFDADFFGMSPREAIRTDPQQRLLLEVAWEALEDAGQVPERLAGAPVGVFVGISTNDYGRLLSHGAGASDAYVVAGNAASIAANRLSYVFDFRGPSLAIDTACSSSLVAIHLACQSLRNGEATLALAGGVNVILSPEISANFSKAGFLAPDGRCKAFDARANGYVRGEGAGVVVLKPLARALADGDPVYAVIRGGAVNQDGRTNGLTAPSRQAQEAVLREAYRRAGVSPGQVEYIEAHGTGTLLGDPIEAKALGAVLAEGRPRDGRCALGSVKTNIGHLEAAAGVAGLIKVALSLRHQSIPPSLHFLEPNPHIPFDALPFRVQQALGDWPESDGPALAGVSSFGFGGTNAHLVLEGVATIPAAGRPAEDPSSGAALLLPISARSPEALRALARSYRDFLSAPGTEASWPEVVATATTRRGHHDHRLALVARSREEGLERLDAFLQGEDGAGLSTGRRMPSGRPQIAFVFPGQGSTWWGTGRQLLEREPVFAATLDECDRRLQEHAGWSLREELTADTSRTRLAETKVAQPVLFGLQVALASLWRSWGIVPDAVVGHDVGELAAAHVAGALSLEDALRIAIHRGRLMQRVSGEKATDGEFSLRGELVEALASLRPSPTAIPLISTVTGQAIDGRDLDADYWGRNLTETVRFAAAVDGLAQADHGIFLEMSPQPVLADAIAQCLRQRKATLLPPLQSEDEGRAILLASLGTLYTQGCPVDWSRLSPPSRYAKLPTYPWQRERFWVEDEHEGANGHLMGLGRNGHANGNGCASVNGNGAAPHSARNGHAPAVRPETNGHAPTSNGHAPDDAEGPRSDTLLHDEPTTAESFNGDLLYEVEWQPKGRSTNGLAVRPGAVEPEGRWLIFADAGGVGEALRSLLEARGATCNLVFAAEAYGRSERGDFHINPACSDDYRRVFTDAFPSGKQSGRGVLHLWGLDAAAFDEATLADLDEAESRGCGSVLHLVQSLAGLDGPRRPRLWLVTRGAEPVGVGSSAPAVLQAPLWGMGRSLALEHPESWGGLVDLDPNASPDQAAALLEEVQRPEGENQLAFRQGRRYVARLVRRKGPAVEVRDLELRPEGTYLVTGGLGDLGLLAARWLVERGARRLVLLGRRGLPGRGAWGDLPEGDTAQHQVAAIRDLERLGVTVMAAAADVADLDGMSALFEHLRNTLPAIRGIVHAAGVVAAQASRDVDPTTLGQVLRPKVTGTWVLHQLTRDLPLDFFVSFSSIAAIIGAKEAHYAAANHFLDAYAHHLHGQGRPSLSVNWGPWSGAGMANAPDRMRAFKLLGLRPLRSDRGFEVLEALIGAEARQVTVADVDWFTFKTLYGQDGRRPFLERIDDEQGPAQGPAHDRGLALRGMSPDRRREQLVQYFQERVSGVLGLEPGRVDPERPLDTLGLDSLMAIELKSGVEADLGTPLSLTSLMQGPTIAELATQMLARWEDPAPGPMAVLAPALEVVSEHPLSFGQQSLWYLHQLAPESAAYNLGGAARIRAELDVDVLRRSFQRLVDRHASLRTTFPAADGRPVQRIHDRLDVWFQVEDASALSKADVHRRLAEEARRPFDLEAGPLFRTHLFSRSAQEHYLLLVVHHVVSDFWSIAVLMHELSQIYPAERAGMAPTLGPLELQYTDFVRWQGERLAGPEGQRLWGYWQSHLAGPLPVLDLPTDRPRPAVQTDRGATKMLHLDGALTRRLVDLGAAQGASQYITLLAAFQVLLARYSGQDDILVGSPVAGRNGPGLTDVVGYFVNPLPMRARFAGDPTFEEFLRQVRRTVLDGLEHQELPFGLLVDRLQLARDPSRSPLFQVMFVYQKAQRLDAEGLTPFALREAGPQMNLGGFPLESVALDQQAAQFDLTMMAAEAEGRLAISLEYNTDLFDAATIDRLLGHFRTLLEGIVAHPRGRVSDLSLMPEHELQRVLVGWNATNATYPRSACIQQLFEAEAERQPEAIAVAFEDLRLTYGELDARANRLAHHLRRLGVGPEVRVGLCVERSVEMIVGILGILKAGGAYVPLDPEYPAERLAFLVDDSHVPVLLTQERLRDGLPAGVARLVCLDSDWPKIAEEDDRRPEAGVAADNLAYVIYTSGSTGKPKGVLVSHGNLVHSTYARFLAYPDRIASFLWLSSFAFDSSVAGLFWTLCQGGQLVLPRPGAQNDPIELAGLIDEHRVSHMLCVPSLYALVLAEAPIPKIGRLRNVIVAGEPCPRELVVKHRSRLPQADLFNEYGPTEATVWCSVYRCRSADARSQVSIGRPIANTQMYVLDAHLRPVPAGVTGEVYIGGLGLARGYLGRPGLTADRFLPNPFGTEPGSRLYRTGDLARWRPDGDLDFLGRVDNQVKIRGFRIEPGEVESALALHPSVREAVAVAREDTPGDARLVAYVVAADDALPSGPELRRWLKERLPESMVPAAIVRLEAIPLSPNGKVDRNALPAPDPGRNERADDYVAPRNPVEETLARIAAELLGLEKVGIHDNFFDLGVDSILSIQIVSRARQAGLHLNPGHLFQHQSIAELAPVVNASAPIIAEQGLVVGPVPLMPIQRWFFDQDSPEPHHFNQALLLEVDPTPDAALMSRAVEHLLRHHDALRLRFSRDEAGWQQWNAADDASAPFSRVDLSALPPDQHGPAIEAEANRLQAGLDLTTGPLLRVALFDLGPGRPGRLFLVVHHLAIDGVSWRILLEDLATAYRQLGGGQDPVLPPKTTSFRQWAEVLAQYAEAGPLEREVAYWLGEGRPHVAPLPVDFGEGGDPGTVAGSATVSVALDADETRSLLQEVPQAYNTQINDALLTALAQALAGWTGRRTLLVDLEGHGRDEAVGAVDLSRTVGWLTTVYPVRLELGEGNHPGEALRSIKEQLWGVPRRGIGYGILRHLRPDPDIAERLAAMPRPEIRFNYLGQFDQSLPESAGLAPALESVGALHSPSTPRGHLLEVDGYVVGGRLHLRWTYGTEVHRLETIEGLAGRFLEALRALIAHCQSPEVRGYTPSDFPLARLDQPTLDRAFAGERNIEDIYPLSPVQEGMLFHTMYAPDSGVYLQQLTAVLRGDLDVSAFVGAWRRVVARHPVLRTAFLWVDSDRPLQVVSRQVQLPVEEWDWRGMAPAHQEERLAEFLRADRERGFDPSRAPLVRLALVRRADDVHQLIWSYHHLVLDGWCLPIVIQEVLAGYEALRGGRELALPPARPFRDYIAWLQEQDLARAEAFWRQELQDFRSPTPLAVALASRNGAVASEPYAELSSRLPAAATAALHALGRAHQLTLNTLVQGAWALLLNRYCGQSDVVFGATVSGRPAALAGVESMVGMFINTLPVRVRVPDGAPLLPWLAELQARQVELREHEHSPLVQVQGWSEVPRGQPLFESIVVFENYPLDASLPEKAGSLGVEDVRGLERTNYPLTLLVIPGAELVLRVGYDVRRFDPATIERLLGHLQTLLEGIADDPVRRLVELPLLTLAEQKMLRHWNGIRPELAAPREDGLRGALAQLDLSSTWDFERLLISELDHLSSTELDGLIDRLLIQEEARDE